MRLSAVLFAAALAVLSGPPVLAAHGKAAHGKVGWELAARDDDNKADRGRRHGDSRDQAARRAQREYGGRVLSVDRVPGEEQQPARYRIKLFSEGNVRTVDVEAEDD